MGGCDPIAQGPASVGGPGLATRSPTTGLAVTVSRLAAIRQVQPRSPPPRPDVRPGRVHGRTSRPLSRSVPASRRGSGAPPDRDPAGAGPVARASPGSRSTGPGRHAPQRIPGRRCVARGLSRLEWKGARVSWLPLNGLLARESRGAVAVQRSHSCRRYRRGDPIVGRNSIPSGMVRRIVPPCRSPN